MNTEIFNMSQENVAKIENNWSTPVVSIYSQKHHKSSKINLLFQTIRFYAVFLVSKTRRQTWCLLGPCSHDGTWVIEGANYFSLKVFIIRVCFFPSLMFSSFSSLLPTSLFIPFKSCILRGAKIGSWYKKILTQWIMVLHISTQ